MNKITYILPFFLLSTNLIFSQETGNLSGTVVDMNTNEPVVEANITVQNTKRGTTTDFNGRFNISNLEIGKYIIKISHVGYTTLEQEIDIEANKTIDLIFKLSEDPLALDEVFVSATRTKKTIDRVTASVEVINAKDIERMGAQTVKDIFQNTPGLNLQYGTFPSASSASKSSVTIRGIGGAGTLWLLDGRRISSEVKNPYEMDRIPASMIERIEIIKGSMSALYGADAMGGVINIITKKSKGVFTGDVNISYGANADGDGANFPVNANIRGSLGKLRYSLYGSSQNRSSYTELEKTNTKVGGGRHAPSQTPPSPGYLNPNGPTGGKPFYMQADGSVKPMPLNPANLLSDRIAAQNAFNQFRSAVSGNIKDNYNTDVTYIEGSFVSTIGGRLDYDFSDKFTTGIDVNYFQEDRKGVYNGFFHPMGYKAPIGHKINPIVGYNLNGTPISFFEKFGKVRGRIPAWNVPVNSKDDNYRFDTSIDLNYTPIDKLKFYARVYNSFYKKRNTSTLKEFADFGYPTEEKSAASGMSADVTITSFEAYTTWVASKSQTIILGGEYRTEGREATVFSQGPGFDERNVNYLAFYLQDEWNITDNFNLTIGGRYDAYTQKSYTDGLGNIHQSNTNDKFTFRIGAVNKFDELISLRANFAQGYRVPDIRELFIQKNTPAGLQLGAHTVLPQFNKTAYDINPESINTYELAISGNNNRFFYEVVGFYNDVTNMIEKIAVDANNDNKIDYFTFINLSNATTSGLELRLKYNLLDNVNLDFFWTELKTENKETNKDLEFNPERTINLGVNWDVSKNFNLNTIVNYLGEQYYVFGGNENKTDDYTLVNLNARYKLNSNFELFGGINNVLDTKVEKVLGSNVGSFFFAGFKAHF
jgi:outer membrane receptor for ferrienterochelin and colicins